MYAFTRFDMGVSTIDLDTNTEVSHTLLFNPEPDLVRTGRPVMYDATFSSSNGEASCASCHIFGDLDALAWDLGNPNAAQQDNILDFELRINGFLALLAGVPNINGTGQNTQNSMKGPMTTQTLKGMVNSGAMHWRGDRAIGFFGQDKTDPRLSFNNFIVAFPELLGSEMEPTDPELQERMFEFTEFALSMQLPPNPVRNLDRSFTPLQQAGNDFFRGPVKVDSGQRTCTECHEVNPASGRFGTNLKATFEGEVQDFKVPHIRNMYAKVGMFGAPETGGVREGANQFMGDQVRGTGFIHDGSIDTLERFFAFDVFDTDVNLRRQLEAAMLVADTDLAPIVGQQITITADATQAARDRVELLRQRSRSGFVSKELGGQTTECDLIAHVGADRAVTGWLYLGEQDQFVGDTLDADPRTLASLLAAPGDSGAVVTFSCVTPGSGYRLALDADLDRVRNGDEIDVVEPPPPPADDVDVAVVVSCLAGNGRVDLNLVNQGSAAAVYRLEFEGLTAREVTVGAGDWGRIPITGRPDRPYAVLVKRDGIVVHDTTIEVSCDAAEPQVSSPDVQVVNACRAGNGYILFQFVNATADSLGYVIEFEGVPNRSTSAQAFGASVRAVTGRPDGSYDVRIRHGGDIVTNHTVEVSCDAP